MTLGSHDNNNSVGIIDKAGRLKRETCIEH